MKKITTIVITGGPCAGKTLAMPWLREHYTARGYTVIFTSETCTEMMTGGLYPWSSCGNQWFQRSLLEIQQTKERMFRVAASHMPDERILLFCDRAAFDNRVYMTEEEFSWILRDMGTSVEQVLAGYDAVFHMTTVARGTWSEYEQGENNKTRYEDSESAIRSDIANLEAWKVHPRLRVIPPAPTFEEKLSSLAAEIDRFLAEQEDGRE